MMAAAWTVYLKELVDALRDRRTLLVVLLSSVAIGPAVLVLVSQLVGGIEKRAEALARMLDMQPLLDRRTDGFSQGERMKTALARALVHDPAHIVLDEPTNGLDVLATRSLRDTLRRLRDDQGKCIVFSTHIMQEVERLCDEVVVVAHGRTVAVGSVAELNAASGQGDFEQTFVELAFGADERQRPQATRGAA